MLFDSRTVYLGIQDNKEQYCSIRFRETKYKTKESQPRRK